MSTMSPPASAMACAILATTPRVFWPVVVTTAREFFPATLGGSPDPPGARSAGRRPAALGLRELVVSRAAATSDATSEARLAGRLPARATTAAVTRATSARTSPSLSATRDLHAIDDRHHRRVDGDVRLGARGQGR